MIARRLRFASLLVATAALALALWLIERGHSAPAAIGVALALVLAVHGLPLAIEFFTGALIDPRPLGRLGPLAFIRLWWGETWRQFRVFMIDQPWRSNFSEPALRFDPERPALLLIHGYLCNRATWKPWLAPLAREHNVATVNLEPAYSPIEAYVATIAAAVERLQAASGARQVTLVCHSMGGLVAREYLRVHGKSRIQRLITLATPHHGTVFARLGQGANARQMERDSSFITRLGVCPVPVTCIATQHDNLVVPRSSPILPGADTVWLDRVGHLAMTDDARALAAVIAAIK